MLRSNLTPRRRLPVSPDQLAAALAYMFPGLLVRSLPNETPEERAARRDAAWDILDDLLAEAVTA